MHRIDLTTVVPGGRAAAFDASLTVDVHAASMRRSGERAIGGVRSGRLGPGETVTWQARHFGIRWRMTSKISEYERPYRFTDEQISGPLRSWRHVHLFVASDPSATVMRDVIEFSAPAGVLGWLVAATILRPYLRRLVLRRNAYLRRALAINLARSRRSDPGR